MPLRTVQRPRKRRPPRPLPPSPVKYLRAMSRIMDHLETAAREELLDSDGFVRADEVPPDVADRFRRLRRRVDRELTEGTLSPLLRDVAEAIGIHATRQQAKIMRIRLREDNVLGGFLDLFIRENVNLIRSVPARALTEIEGLIQGSVVGQARVEDLATLIQRRFAVARSRAELIARDQTLKANAQVTRLRQQQVGITRYTWITSRDERVRDEHVELDGTLQEWTHPPIVALNGDRAHPGEYFQCRCTASPDTSQILPGADGGIDPRVG